MLTILCAACRSKLWKYEKRGYGHVVRCHKEGIVKWYKAELVGNKVHCKCGKAIGVDKETSYRMISGTFTHTGTKQNKK